MDPEPRPRFAAFALARGQAKSTVAAALGCFVLLLGGEDVSVDVVAVDERQARIIFGMAAKFVARHPALRSRVLTYKDRMTIPWLGSEFACLPASAAALEGRNPDLCICDEGGRIDAEVFEVVSLAAGKKPRSLVLLVGTPGPECNSVLARFRQHSIDHPEDKSQVYREISAAAWPDHPTTCDDHGDGPGTGCISIANPGLAAGLLHLDGLMACQPPKMTESHFRRTRLVQWITGAADPAIPALLWKSLARDESIPDHSDVVLAFDGSYSGADATVLLAATVSKTPHLEVIGVWAKEWDDGPDWRVPVMEVEEAIRQACKRFRVREVACDPARWMRSFEVLEAEGWPMARFDQGNARMTPATSAFLHACHEHQISHANHPVLNSHIANAVLMEENRGARLEKASRSRHAGRIDAAVCAVMAHSRAMHYATRPRKRYATFKA